ncbi:MAG: hypothetical protein AAF661_05075 [Pseudomonadota bacterium]
MPFEISDLVHGKERETVLDLALKRKKIVESHDDPTVAVQELEKAVIVLVMLVESLDQKNDGLVKELQAFRAETRERFDRIMWTGLLGLGSLIAALVTALWNLVRARMGG